MKISKFKQYIWQKLSNPWTVWSRLFLGMIFPVVLYSQDIILIMILVLALTTNIFWFPKPTESMHNDFTYHGIRGSFLLKMKETDYYSSFWKKYAGNTRSKIIFMLITATISILSFIMIWYQFILEGAFFYYIILISKMLYLSECATVSHMNPHNETWDNLMNDSNTP